MTGDNDKRRQARSEFIYKRRTLAMIGLSVGVSTNTIGRWKRAALAAGDNWETARAAHMIAGEGLDAVITTVVEEFMIMAQSAIDDLKADGLKERADQLPIDKRIMMMTSLADAMTKMTASAGKLAPKISELGVAQDVIQRLMVFVRDNYPEHAQILLQISAPFSDHLVEAYA
ncbi:hypothetical protein AN189_02935 [Loktanella sp. 3ANDIMAR09]|uniref:DUF1804 family protein n=1 Tax=Loktanella sp. 3ANDIMAR09 TaxID=1225657 RepID=UPI000700173A|nr:DUF1804 family protein [Loktanella sp. 3ANDIMAR09]KQI69393.1 hypothetical protein AN189_02935 [Loktanella sp. 3ANDIMAR09]